MQRLALYAVSFVAGAAVLALEILGTRFIGPFYGVTLYSWSALITVTLLALASGYFVGGRQAQKRGSLSFIALLMGGAGAWILLVAALRRPVILLFEPLGLRGAVLGAAMALLFVPLMLLGMVSPIAVRVYATKLSRVGRAAGDLYALSTAGGVVAALLTGFVLIPHVGVQSLTIAIAVTLLATACATMLGDKKRQAAAAVALVAILAGGIGGIAGASDQPGASRVREVRQSFYGELRVLDLEDGSRHLLIDGGVHSSVMTGTWRSLQDYIWVIDGARGFFDAPGDLLVVGLGAGSTPTSYADAGWRVTAVEIDPAVTDIAYEHFGLGMPRKDIVHDDGRRFLAATAKRYDLIVFDAFSSNSVPVHLFTQEAFELVARRLDKDGVFVANIESEGRDSPLVRAIATTLRTQFSQVTLLPARSDEDALLNIVVVAANRELRLDEPIGQDSEDATPEARRRIAAWRDRFTPSQPGALLTDDLSPLDVWSEEVNVRSRQAMNDSFDEMGLRGLNW